MKCACFQEQLTSTPRPTEPVVTFRVFSFFSELCELWWHTAAGKVRDQTSAPHCPSNNRSIRICCAEVLFYFLIGSQRGSWSWEFARSASFVDMLPLELGCPFFKNDARQEVEDGWTTASPCLDCWSDCAIPTRVGIVDTLVTADTQTASRGHCRCGNTNSGAE